MLFGLVGSSYTARSSAVAYEECINMYVETLESTAPIAPGKEYGGSSAGTKKSLFSTPGLKVFATLPESPVRASCNANGRIFVVGGSQFYEIGSDGNVNYLGTIGNDGRPASIAASNTELLIVSAGQAFCFNITTQATLNVTAQLAGAPIQAVYSDGYFIVCFRNSNKYQISNLLDGTTWNPIYVNAVSVFPENIVGLAVLHRELWVFGSRHAQAYYDSGSANIFDVIGGGSLIEKGCAATFAPCALDNSMFWIDEDDRGSRMAWRSNNYSPQRISTHAVEDDLQSYADISGMTSYAYQQGGHLFWVLYIPGSTWSWVYDVSEGLWHKRGSGWNGTNYQPHYSQNHVFGFGKHLVGDWNSGKLYQMDPSFLDDAGTPKRWLRRAPTVINEMQRIYHAELVLDFETGVGPQVPLTDGAGNPRSPQAMVRWSDDRGQTWSNEHVVNIGLVGQYKTRAIVRRLGQSRYRVYEISGSDPVSFVLVDGYLRTA